MDFLLYSIQDTEKIKVVCEAKIGRNNVCILPHIFIRVKFKV